MLDAIESRLTAIVGESLAERTHVSVVRAPASLAAPNPGGTLVRVALGAVTPEATFERGTFHVTKVPTPTSRRVLPIRFGARLEFRARPDGTDPPALASARARLLGDLAVAAHFLGAEPVRSGSAFASSAPDPGFRVLAFGLSRCGAASDADGGLLSAELECEGGGIIWPPELARDEGVIARLDVLVAAPLDVHAVSPRVPLGGTASVRIAPFAGSRLDPGGARGPASLALKVVSDLPLDRRGSITEGSSGAETGVKIIQASSEPTVVTYRAPTGDVGATRTEYVTVHLASADGRSGAFLGSAALKLEVASP
jgi:hypothetical protein